LEKLLFKKNLYSISTTYFFCFSLQIVIIIRLVFELLAFPKLGWNYSFTRTDNDLRFGHPSSLMNTFDFHRKGLFLRKENMGHKKPIRLSVTEMLTLSLSFEQKSKSLQTYHTCLTVVQLNMEIFFSFKS